ncbi:MAG: CoB--CoM heterodisulfide reductase iron-sulfur subunit A family protein [Candidatus Fermentibacteraceae bacterium]|nr:CoB--CoM heterodisulfide reductase iron-sulfur subunit A family protein [Candidatus Fermentibacteraceae bacterium]MBN2608825.1 CoB--CoM heterodisulfide reductase iron-sulfur subunit A family protein [Candidatus Fermentibacteraceae bacterium]
MKRIGVFICHCGINIAGTVDVKRVAEEVAKLDSVVYAQDYIYMCSDPGQALVREKIRQEKLDGIIIAACSPSLHESTFRTAAEEAGLNPWQCEIANIREQCSWVHTDRKKATEKAIRIVSTMVEKTRLNESLEPIPVSITKKALVIGGGIAGIQAALDIADSGHKVILVEKESSIGGHMAQLSETFPTLDCSQCILTPKMVAAGKHRNIQLMTYSEVEEVSGYVGNFNVRIRRKAPFVDWSTCTGCGLCMEKCPAKVPSEFDRGLSTHGAIYIPFPQAVPNKPVIDRESCIYFKTGKCRLCEKTCEIGAIKFDQEDQIIEEEIGAIITATGYETLPVTELQEYGAGEVPDVIDGLAFERLLSASGPTSGEVRRPSDGRVPKEVVFVQCAGSRDPERYRPYCSKICCMYTTKHALLYKHRVHDGQPYIFYIDIRTGGKGYEEFYHNAEQDEGIIYLRGKVAKIFRDGDKTIVWGTDTLTGRNVEIQADLVVLATAVVPRESTAELVKKLRIQTGPNGFLSEAHPKLRPVESINSGFFIAGVAQGPRDIPETVAQASGAACKVISLFSRDHLEQDPAIAWVDEELCGGCRICISVCPYDAREYDEEKCIARVNEALCEGCGSCVAACACGATQQRNLSDSQIKSMVTASLGGE